LQDQNPVPCSPLNINSSVSMLTWSTRVTVAHPVITHTHRVPLESASPPPPTSGRLAARWRKGFYCGAVKALS